MEKLDHPNIIPLLAFCIDYKEAVIRTVSPLADGGNVSTYLIKARPNMATRLQLVGTWFLRICLSPYHVYISQALDTANGLSYLHEQELCHGRLTGVRRARSLLHFQTDLTQSK